MVCQLCSREPVGALGGILARWMEAIQEAMRLVSTGPGTVCYREDIALEDRSANSGTVGQPGSFFFASATQEEFECSWSS